MKLFYGQEERRSHILTDPIAKLIPAIALPSIISMLVGAIYNMADTFFVGKLGNSATGATGIVFPIVNLLQAVSFIFAHGATSCISRRLGNEETEQASRIATTALFFAVGLGAVFALIGIVMPEPVLRLFGATATILPYAKAYAVFIFIAAPFYAGTYVMNNALRSEGSAQLSMFSILTGVGLNIILDPIFIFTCNLGIAGAGLATMLGQMVTFSMELSFYLRKKTENHAHSALTISPKLFTPTRAMLSELTQIGIPSFFRLGFASLAILLLDNAAAAYGDACIAAFSIVNRLMWLVSAVVSGYAQGFQPICGFNYGAERIDRVKEAYRFTIATAVAFTVVCGTILFLFAPWFISLFRNDPAVIAAGAPAVRMQAVTLPLVAVVLISTMLFQAINRAAPALVLVLSRQGLFFIPLVLLLPRVIGLTGLQIAQPLADGISFFVAIPLIVATLRQFTGKT